MKVMRYNLCSRHPTPCTFVKEDGDDMNARFGAKLLWQFVAHVSGYMVVDVEVVSTALDRDRRKVT